MLQAVIRSKRLVLQRERLLLQNVRLVLQSERLLLHGFEAKQSCRRAFCSLQKVCNRERTPGSRRFLEGQFVRENAYFRLSASGSDHILPFRSFGSSMTSSGEMIARFRASRESFPNREANLEMAGMLS